MASLSKTPNENEEVKCFLFFFLSFSFFFYGDMFSECFTINVILFTFLSCRNGKVTITTATPRSLRSSAHVVLYAFSSLVYSFLPSIISCLSSFIIRLALIFIIFSFSLYAYYLLYTGSGVFYIYHTSLFFFILLYVLPPLNDLVFICLLLRFNRLALVLSSPYSLSLSSSLSLSHLA